MDKPPFFKVSEERLSIIEQMKKMRVNGQNGLHVRPAGYWKGEEEGFSGYFPMVFDKRGIPVKPALRKETGEPYYTAMEYVGTVESLYNTPFTSKLFPTPEAAMEAWQNGSHEDPENFPGLDELERIPQ